MLSKCANPACLARFRYLHEGRIFNVEIEPGGLEESVRLAYKIEHFWLCESCAKVMKVVRENGVVSLRPLYLALTPWKAQEKVERERNVA